MASIEFFVPATPVPKGSAKMVIIRGKRLVAQSNLGKQKTFARAAAAPMNQAMAGKKHLEGAVAVILRFYVPKPESVTRQFPSVSPDLDKYARLALDVMTAKKCKVTGQRIGGVYYDDGQVCKLDATKEYGERIGCDVRVSEIEAKSNER